MRFLFEFQIEDKLYEETLLIQNQSDSMPQKVIDLILNQNKVVIYHNCGKLRLLPNQQKYVSIR